MVEGIPNHRESSIVPVISFSMMRMKRAFSVAVMAVALACATAPARAIDLPGVLTGYAVASWADGDGRPLGSVYAIAQDLEGYLWIGTDTGLVRFDGWRFTRWETVGNTPLPSSPVSALYVSHDNTVWVGFRDQGIVRRIRNGVMQDDTPVKEQTGLVADIVEDRDRTMWAVIGGGLYRWRASRWEQIPLQTLHSPIVVSVSVGRNGALLVGTTTGLLRRAQDTDAFQTVIGGWAWDASEDSTGTLWITDTSSGFRRSDRPGRRTHELQGNGYRLLHDSRGNLWVATIGEGLWRTRSDAVDGRSIVEKASLYSGLLSDSVQSMIEDREGNIWVGTTGGLHKLNERKVTPVVNMGLVIAVEATGEGGIWAGTGNGVIRLSPQAADWLRERPTSSIVPYVRAVHRDQRGTVWVGSNQGLFRVVDRRLVPVPIPVGDPQAVIIAMTSDRQGTVWFSDGTHLFRWKDGRFSDFELPGARRDRISVIYGDSRGRLWIAFAGGRLSAIEADGTWRHFEGSDDFANVHRAIYDIHEDRNGVVWILGTGGLTRFADGRFATLKAEHGLPSTRIGAIVDDLQGYLWLNIDVGLIRFTPEAFHNALAKPAQRLRYDLYDTSDGVAGAPILNLRARRGNDGTLWFVRGGGLTSVNPRLFGEQASPTAVPVRIEDALVDDGRVATTSGSRVPAGTRRVQINYTALTLRSPNRIRFRYRLDGFDANWIDAGTRRQAFYTNLPPRAYTFQVEATADESAWSGSSAAWAFHIEPRFYQAMWFYVVCVVSVALTAGAAWQLRVRLIRRQFSAVLTERVRLSREIHDTLLQNMIGVALQFDALAESVGALSAEARHTLVRARKQVEGYIREARQSIWDLRSPSLERRELASALRDIGTRATQNTPVHFEATTTGASRQCPARIESAVLRIGQEAITNALRHARAGRIDVELRFDARTVTLRVHDNGCGFDVDTVASDSNGHYGLISMRERAEDIEAEFTIASTKGSGTCVETIVPLEADR
jgi:signal transduction histidine kinase/ligand-binding sensor domain-containing protein